MTKAMEKYWAARRALWERDGGLCGICGIAVDFGAGMDIDHVVQRAEGGSDDPSNLRVTHQRCNRSRPRIKTIWKHVELPIDLLDELHIWAKAEKRGVIRQIHHVLRQAVNNRPTPTD